MINLARNLKLSVEVQTQTFAVLAVRGAGKTYTLLKMAEQMYGDGLQFVFVDPTGVAWGLRSSADGKHAGLPILIFGGERGDVPLEVGSGALVADLIVNEGASCVLDLSDFRKGQMTRFMCDFAERLYHQKNRRRDPLHVFMDEADAFAPQKPQKDQNRMLGAVEDLIRKGRSRGIGLTLATQRSAVLNKNVLTQCETLVAMRVMAPQDIKAVDQWLQHAGDEKTRQLVLKSLPHLETGQAMFWSPRAFQVFKTVKISKRSTFDSSATPKAGKRAKAPKTRADVDLNVVRKQMAATVDRAEAKDPKKLQARVRQLEKELAQAQSKPQVDQAAIDEAVAKAIQETIESRDAAWDKLLDGIVAPPVSVRSGTVKVRLRKRVATKPHQPLTSVKPSQKVVSYGSKTLPLAKQKIIDALGFLGGVGVPDAERTQLALFADTSPKSSGYANNLGALRTAGLIDYPSGGRVCLTDEGKGIVAGSCEIGTEEELHDALERKLPTSKWRIVSACIEAYPEQLHRNELAERASTSPSSSGYANNLGSLRSLGLIDYPSKGMVVACGVLFLEGLA